MIFQNVIEVEVPKTDKFQWYSIIYYMTDAYHVFNLHYL